MSSRYFIYSRRLGISLVNGRAAEHRAAMVDHLRMLLGGRLRTLDGVLSSMPHG